jgi:hypothetical protein
MTVYVERLLLCHAHCFQQKKYSVAARAPTRRHRSPLTSLQLKDKIGRGRFGIAVVSKAFITAAEPKHRPPNLRESFCKYPIAISRSWANLLQALKFF